MSTPPIAVTGPTEAAQPPAAATANPPLPVNVGATHGVGSDVSVTVHMSPNGTVTVALPDPGNVIGTGFGPVYGPPDPVHDTVNRYVPGIDAAPVFLRISNRTGVSGFRSFITVTTPLVPVIGPTVATSPPPGITFRPPLPANTGDGFQLVPGDCSVRTQVAPLGTPIVVNPDPGNTMETGLVTEIGEFPTVQLKLNTYVPGITAAPVFFRIVNAAFSCT